MIDVRKSVEPWCEECRGFEPVANLLVLQHVGGDADMMTTVRCVNHESCSLAVRRYERFKEQENKNENEQEHKSEQANRDQIG